MESEMEGGPAAAGQTQPAHEAIRLRGFPRSEALRNWGHAPGGRRIWLGLRDGERPASSERDSVPTINHAPRAPLMDSPSTGPESRPTVPGKGAGRSSAPGLAARSPHGRDLSLQSRTT